MKMSPLFGENALYIRGGSAQTSCCRGLQIYPFPYMREIGSICPFVRDGQRHTTTTISSSSREAQFCDFGVPWMPHQMPSSTREQLRDHPKVGQGENWKRGNWNNRKGVPRREVPRRGGGKVKQGRFVVLRFPSFCGV